MSKEQKKKKDEVAEEIKEETNEVEEKKEDEQPTELEIAKAKAEELNDKYLRLFAEFDNYKKRTEREKLNVAEFAKASLIKQLLPILDNIDRAALLEDKTSPDYIKGIELIVKQFEGLAEKLGIKEVAKVGDSFDPNCHEAVMHIEDENFGENVIAEVLQKGFKIGDTVIRPAMVKVAN